MKIQYFNKLTEKFEGLDPVFYNVTKNPYTQQLHNQYFTKN